MTHLQFKANKAQALASGFRAVKLGGGGLNSGLDIASDGTMLTRGDVFGVMLWDGVSSWQQLINSNSMPAGDISLGCAGAYEARISPSNTNIFCMFHLGYLYRTVNRGSTWTRTNFPRFADPGGNYGANYNASGYWQKLTGCKIAISPVDPNIIIAGTPGGGVYRSTDGNNFTQISGIATPTNNLGYAIIFIGGSEVLVASNGNGVYRSTDSGATFFITTNGPLRIQNWDLAVDSKVWAVDYDGGSQSVWSILAGTWTKQSVTNTGTRFHAVACHPTNANKVVLMGDGGYDMNFTTNGGTSWFGAIIQPSGVYINATGNDVPWHGAGTEYYMTAGNCKYNPIDGKLYFSMGIGIQWTDDPVGSPVVFRSKSAGIEGLVANYGISPPNGGGAMMTNWDRPMFFRTNMETYPSGHFPLSAYASIIHGWSIDYATSDNNFWALMCNSGTGTFERSSYSQDNGQTWTEFTSKPLAVANSGFIGGHLAVSSPTKMCWFPSNQAPPYYTANGGQTWVKITGWPAEIHIASEVAWDGIDAGWSHAYWSCGHPVCADKVLSDTFYAVNYITHGVYRSTDGGVNWVNRGTNNITGADTQCIYAVPFNAGWLLVVRGYTSSGAPSISKDGGATFNTLAGWNNCIGMGFGKQIPGGYNPTVFGVGNRAVGGDGVYYSSDIDQASPTWTKLGGVNYPNNNYNFAHHVFGDSQIAYKCYVAHSGYGWSYYNP